MVFRRIGQSQLSKAVRKPSGRTRPRRNVGHELHQNNAGLSAAILIGAPWACRHNEIITRCLAYVESAQMSAWMYSMM
jgi:hypothetical protein